MSGQGKSERARGKDQGELPGSDARERKERRAVQRAFHHDGEVAAARVLLDSAARVARPGSSSARQQEGEEERRDAWGPARRKKAARKPLHGAGVGAVGGRRREQSREGEERDKGRFEISKTSRDYSVNKQ